MTLLFAPHGGGGGGGGVVMKGKGGGRGVMTQAAGSTCSQAVEANPKLTKRRKKKKGMQIK